MAANVPAAGIIQSGRVCFGELLRTVYYNSPEIAKGFEGMVRNAFVIILCCTLFLPCILTGCRQGEIKKNWRDDFGLFLDYFAEAASESRKQNNGMIDKSELEDIFLNQKVKWSGTLRDFRSGRVYIEESFLPIDEETKLSVVMYYTDPNCDSQWQNVPKGKQVVYTGVISSVEVDTVIIKSGFSFIRLDEVRPVTSVD